MLPELVRSRPRQAISLTPLIDVVFILLLFFMLSSSFIQWRRIDLPTPVASESEPARIVRVRLLDNDGVIEVNGQRFRLTELEQIRTLTTGQSEPVYAIEAADGVTTQALISLVDGFKRAGIEKVSLAGVLP